MSYAEASYFDGYHFAHIAARDEYERLREIDRRTQRALRGIERRTNRKKLSWTA